MQIKLAKLKRLGLTGMIIITICGFVLLARDANIKPQLISIQISNPLTATAAIQ